MAEHMTYKDAGVNIDAANEAKERMKRHIRETFNSHVVGDIGSFGGMFGFDAGKYKEPVLVSSTDGVGTKIKLAQLTGKHDTIGQDIVNHCVNDILVQGAMPLFFLDYIALGKLEPAVVEEIIKGLCVACKENGAALVGGETAEMPGLYKAGDYDLAGFIVGVVEKNVAIDGRNIKPGDVLIGVSSNGLQTNGYSLALKVLLEKAGLKLGDVIEELGCTLQEALMQIHPSYLRPVKSLIQKVSIKGLAHITGGGLVENIPRILPDGCGAEVKKGTWKVLPIFELIQKCGNVPEDDMYRTFNMGIGLVIIVGAQEAEKVVEEVRKHGMGAQNIGYIVKGDKEVRLC